MTSWKRRIPFRVDIVGVIEILGSALYSRPESAVRELIQNAHDAIVRRRRTDLGYQGRIDIEQDRVEHTLCFQDDGIGLSAEEAETYLSTLGIGITGMMRGRGAASPAVVSKGTDDNLIGMFGVGLFSAFMLADRVVVESRKAEDSEGVRWEAGPGSEIELSNITRERPGTTVTLFLKSEHSRLAEQPDFLEAIIKEYADFLQIPIHLNSSSARANQRHSEWFDPTPDCEALELELETHFGETPLDVIPIRREQPTAVAGALYVTPQRTPGFAGESVVTATVRRMVISRKIQGLLPEWAPFLRGVLEVNGCTPTLSREDLVRDDVFRQVRAMLESLLYEHLERLALEDRARLESILTWHRYTLAGAALTERRLRDLLRRTYRIPTSQGLLTFDQIIPRSEADPLFEAEAKYVLWYNTDRRQEGWVNTLFGGHSVPCVHALRSFEESLLAAMTADMTSEGDTVDLRLASPGSPGFAMAILGMTDLEDVSADWQDFLGADAKILSASFREDRPVMAFLNERSELLKTLVDLKQAEAIPSGFQRMIDAHLGNGPVGRNEVILNRDHRLVARALSQRTSAPLASTLRLLVSQALASAGASPTRAAIRQQAEDLDWIADALWGRQP
ncbi:ATP-binding protein [Singulisphaera sp. Ch08]|uniref:ATP-binding protein n=1 Tax=Singulisphaera sp. Ch08 TaxID=3120278 RepID=A0AAU7C7M3_9BACT